MNSTLYSKLYRTVVLYFKCIIRLWRNTVVNFIFYIKTGLFYICYSLDIPIIINAKINLPSIVI